MKNRIIGFIVVLIIAAGLIIYFRSEQHKEQRITHVDCGNNLKQIALALRVWAGDHENKFPWNVSTNTGGTKELVGLDQNGFDTNAWVHFQAMSNELETPKALVCPNDTSKQPAADFAHVGASNLTYRLHIVPTITPGDSAGAKVSLVFCPADGSTLYYDGHVESTGPKNEPNGFRPMQVPGK